MKIVNNTLLLVFFFNGLFAQAQDKVYLNEDKQECEKEDAVYYRTIEELPADENKLFLIKDYFISGQIQMEGTFLSPETIYEHGEITWFYKNGNKKRKANYNQSLLLGDYLTWYENGEPKTIAEYIKNDFEENRYSILKIQAYWDTTGIQKVKEGNGIFFDDGNDHRTCEILDCINKSYSEGPVVNGLKHGNWTGIEEEIGVTFQEVYLKGILVEGKSVDQEGNEYFYDKSRISPEPKKGFVSFYKYIRKKLRYPAAARKNKVEGKVFVQFIIDKNGDVTESKVIQGIGYGCDEEAVKAISEAPPWQPGKFKGKK